MLQKYKKSIIIISILLVLGLTGYLFFMKTVRGNSWALYIAGGWNAPIKIKYACSKETDQKVYEKFTKPLNFDKESKDLLRNFWYYSYYRGCLFRNGYDFNGNKVPESLVAINIYENKFAGLSFNIPDESVIEQDNSLDVDTDDRLFISKLKTPSGAINIQYYTKHDIFTSEESLNSNFQNIPLAGGKVTRKTLVTLPSGQNAYYFVQDNGNAGLVFVTSQGHFFIIFGSPEVQSEISNIQKSLSVFVTQS